MFLSTQICTNGNLASLEHLVTWLAKQLHKEKDRSHQMLITSIVNGFYCSTKHMFSVVTTSVSDFNTRARNEFIVSYIKYVLLIMFVGYYVSNSWKLNC